MKQKNLWKTLQNTAMRVHVKYQDRRWWRIETALATFAIVAGLMAGCLNHANQRATEEAINARYQTIVIVVAAKDLEKGSVLSRANLNTQSVLAAHVTKNHILERNSEIILGKQITIALKANDPVLLSAIQTGSLPDNIADQIPPGKRLFTLSISDLAAANGFLRVNDHIDVMAHLTLPDRGKTTFTILQDITLISVGRNTFADPQAGVPASNISFFVDVKDAEVLAFAQNRGTFSVSLRNPKDVATKVGRGVDIEDFLDHEKINEASGGGNLTVTEQGRRLNAKSVHH